MPLFRINESLKMEIVKKQSFTKEKELQGLIERNMDEVFGIRFLESEYPIPNGRIDTLGLDENTLPVVIEYKKKQDLGNAIIQGLFYIDWVKQNKRTFEMLIREKLSKDAKVDWTLTPRLIIIAEAFDPKEISAINQIITNVELKKFSFYREMISIEDVTIAKVSRGTFRTADEVVEKPGPPTIEEHLAKTAPKIRQAFLNIREEIFQIGEDIEEKTTKTMICYYNGGKGLAWFNFSGKRLRLHLRKGTYSDKYGKLKPGFGDCPSLTLRQDELDVEHIEYLKDLIRQAYEKQ